MPQQPAPPYERAADARVTEYKVREELVSNCKNYYTSRELS